MNFHYSLAIFAQFSHSDKSVFVGPSHRRHEYNAVDVVDTELVLAVEVLAAEDKDDTSGSSILPLPLSAKLTGRSPHPPKVPAAMEVTMQSLGMPQMSQKSNKAGKQTSRSHQGRLMHVETLFWHKLTRFLR